MQVGATRLKRERLGTSRSNAAQQGAKRHKREQNGTMARATRLKQEHAGATRHGASGSDTARHKRERHSTAQAGATRRKRERHGTARHKREQHSTAQAGATRHGASGSDTARHKRERHGTAQAGATRHGTSGSDTARRKWEEHGTATRHKQNGTSGSKMKQAGVTRCKRGDFLVDCCVGWQSLILDQGSSFVLGFSQFLYVALKHHAFLPGPGHNRIRTPHTRRLLNGRGQDRLASRWDMLQVGACSRQEGHGTWALASPQRH
jgi:hypothetical protein